MLSLLILAGLTVALPAPQLQSRGTSGTILYNGSCKMFQWDPKPQWEKSQLASIPLSKPVDCRKSDKPCYIDHADKDTKRPTQWVSSAKLSEDGTAAIEKAIAGGELPSKPDARGFEGPKYSLPVDQGQVGYLSYNPFATVVKGTFKGCEDGQDHEGILRFPTGEGSVGLVYVSGP